MTTSLNLSDLKPRPRKALNAYNIFYTLERHRIIAAPDADASSLPPLHSTVTIADMQRICKENQTKPKRAHRKTTNGKLRFQEMNRIIAQRWKQVPAYIKMLFQQQAEQDRIEVESRMIAWKTQQEQMANYSQPNMRVIPMLNRSSKHDDKSLQKGDKVTVTPRNVSFDASPIPSLSLSSNILPVFEPNTMRNFNYHHEGHNHNSSQPMHNDCLLRPPMLERNESARSVSPLLSACHEILQSFPGQDPTPNKAAVASSSTLSGAAPTRNVFSQQGAGRQSLAQELREGEQQFQRQQKNSRPVLKRQESLLGPSPSTSLSVMMRDYVGGLLEERPEDDPLLGPAPGPPGPSPQLFMVGDSSMNSSFLREPLNSNIMDSLFDE